MATMVPELVELATRIQSDPSFYLREILGGKPYPKQIEIANSLATERRVSVVGCNGSGKDWLAARLALWWVTSYYPAKVVITGPTYRQVSDVIFNELKEAYRSTGVSGGLGGKLYDAPRWQLDETTFITGFATDKPWNLQGFHSPNLLVIVTEAHGMSEDSINALYRLNPRTMLMTGNPFAVTGPFYNSHHKNRTLWRTFQISAYDTPNLQGNGVVVPGMVTSGDVADREQEWGADSSLYRGSVLGEFVEDLADVILPLSILQQSLHNEVTPEGETTVGCDVARFGKDKTIVALRQGNHAEIIHKTQGKDLMGTAGWLGRYCEDQNIDKLVIDDTGLGGGVTDRLNEVGIPGTEIVAFKGGESAKSSDRFANRIAEAWWVMRDWVMNGGRIPNDDALVGQLSTRGYSIQSDRRIALTQKSKMANSPDEADALAMAIYGDYDTAGVGVW